MLARDDIARWDGVNWTVIPEPSRAPATLFVHEDRLYAGGIYPMFGGFFWHGMVRWTGSAWEDLLWIEGSVEAMEELGGRLYAGGNFESFRMASIARLENSQSWSSLEPVAAYDPVHVMARDGDDVILGGGFSAVGWRNHTPPAVRWTKEGLQPFGAPFVGEAFAAVRHGGELVMAGNIVTAGSTTRVVTAWDGAAMRSLGEVWAGYGPRVFAMTLHEGRVVAAGWFGSIGGRPANSIARWDGVQWEPYGVGFDNRMHALLVHDGQLVAGGESEFSGFTRVNRIARWDGSAWQPFGLGADGLVSALASFEGDLIAAGEFAAAGGAPASCVARWNGAAWEAMGDGLARGGMYGYGVRALAVHTGELLAGGYFEGSGPRPIRHLARWDGKQWQPFDEPVNGPVVSLLSSQGDLFVGGEFTRAGSIGAAGAARWGCACCPDCDRSSGPFVLDIFDFLCFQNRYDSGDPYACDCDTSTGPGACDIFDFLCFQNAYDAGCP